MISLLMRKRGKAPVKRKKRAVGIGQILYLKDALQEWFLEILYFMEKSPLKASVPKFMSV